MSPSRSDVASDFQSETLTAFTVTSIMQNFALWLSLLCHISRCGRFSAQWAFSIFELNIATLKVRE
jgi:hypothetical protein